MGIHASERPRKIGSVLHRELSDIVSQKMADPRIKPITITEVVVSNDLRHAKVYATCINASDHLEPTLENLNRARGYIRCQLSNQVHLKYVPTLKFVADEVYARGNRILSLIQGTSQGTSDSKQEQE